MASLGTRAGVLLAGLLAVCGLQAASAQAAPTIGATWASGVAASTAELKAEIDPTGLPTTARAEFILAATYEANLAAIPPRDGFFGASVTGSAGVGSGTGLVPFTRKLASLAPDTAYRFRFLATNSSGTAVGPTRAFATAGSALTFALPDSRGWELVSPTDKNGGQVAAPGTLFGGGVIQAAAQGGAVSYGSGTAFALPLSASLASQYLSSRGPSGWSTANLTVPALAGAFGPDPDGVPFQLFSPDLGQALVLSPQRCAAAPCPRGYLRRTSGGALSPSPMAADSTLAGANESLDVAILASAGNLYRWSAGSYEAINVLPGDIGPTLGATLAAEAGAVSTDGTRVYFSHAGNLYLRTGSETVQVDEAVGGGGTFETASADGALALFSKEGHLHRFNAVTETSTDLTPSGGVLGVLGASPSGAIAYYLAADGLFRHQGGSATKVAAAADASNHPPATGTARVAADGSLLFLSSAVLTDYDPDGKTQVYLYRPGSGQLTCLSCNPTGARPIGPSTIPGARSNGTEPSATQAYKPRVLSADAQRVFFDSEDALLPFDTNNEADVYQWEAPGTGSCQRAGGCLALISSGRGAEGALFLDASADGSDAFFLTDESLVPGDPGSADVYDARVGGGFPVPPTVSECLGDACQPLPGEPEDPNPGTGLTRAVENEAKPSPQRKAKAKGKKAKKKSKARKAKSKKQGKGKGKAKKGGRR